MINNSLPLTASITAAASADKSFKEGMSPFPFNSYPLDAVTSPGEVCSYKNDICHYKVLHISKEYNPSIIIVQKIMHIEKVKQSYINLPVHLTTLTRKMMDEKC